MKLLHIIASPRGENSRTLKVSREFLSSLKEKNPNLIIKDFDVFKENLPEVTGSAIDAKYALMQGGSLNEQTKKSWEEISKLSMDFLSYDYYLITSPMWNFSIPYKLKHYIDVIMQAGILFGYTEKGVEGLAKNKKMYCISSSGSDYNEGNPMHRFDFLEPYLRSIFGLIGIYDVTFIKAQPMDYDPAITQTKFDMAVDEAKVMAMDNLN